MSQGGGGFEYLVQFIERNFQYHQRLLLFLHPDNCLFPCGNLSGEKRDRVGSGVGRTRARRSVPGPRAAVALLVPAPVGAVSAAGARW